MTNPFQAVLDDPRVRAPLEAEEAERVTKTEGWDEPPEDPEVVKIREFMLFVEAAVTKHPAILDEIRQAMQSRMSQIEGGSAS